MKIGKVRLTVPVTLAPMEEHTNFPFRLLMKRFGAGMVCTERIDAATVARRDRRALRMLYTTAEERPRAAQISGAEPAVMAAAARVVEQQGFDAGRFELRMSHSADPGSRRGRSSYGRAGRYRADRRGRHPRRVAGRDRQAAQRTGRGARNGGRSRPAGPGCGRCRDRSPRPERGPILRRQSGLGCRRAGEAGRARARTGQWRNPRGRRRPALAAGKRCGRRVDRPRLPRQPLDLPPGPGTPGRERPSAGRRRAPSAAACCCN